MSRWRVGVVLIMVMASLTMLPLATHTAAAEDVVLEHGTALPPVPEGHSLTNMILLADDTVYAGIRAQPVTTDTPLVVYRTASDGTGDWSAVIDPATGDPLTSPMVAADGSQIVVSGPQLPATACNDYRVIQGGTARGFTSCSTPVVGRGGLVARSDAGGAWLVEQGDGAPLQTLTTRPALEGAAAWTYEAGAVHGRDVVAETDLPARHVPDGCAVDEVTAVADGHVLVGCVSSSRFAVLDVQGDLPPWPLAGTGWKLGAGFAARLSSTGGTTAVLVTDLGAGKAERWIAGSWFAVDRGSGARILSRVADNLLEVVDLAPLASRGSTPDDVTPPSIDFSGPGALSRGAPYDLLAYSWGGSDPVHGSAVSYQVREAWPQRGESPVWGEARTARGPLTVQVGPGRTFCFQARTRDWAGNVSPWAGTPCTYVDGTGPVTRLTVAAPRDLLTGTPVNLRWAATDDDSVASYEVVSKIALPGRPWSAWTSKATTATGVTRSIPAGAVDCSRVRALDRAGNVGAYTPGYWCVWMPYDDRDFARHRGARRVTHKRALGHTATRLTGRASLTHRGIRADKLWVRVVGRAPESCPRIYIAGKRVDNHTCSRTREGRHIWYGYHFHKQRVGDLRIRPGTSVRTTGQLIDAIAIGR